MGPARIALHLGLNPSMVHRVLRRYRMPCLSCLDQATGLPVRKAPARAYVYDAPGDMVHMGIKKQGRIPDGGSWRMLGRGNTTHRAYSGVGYAYLHHLVDDCSRLAYSEILADERKDTVVAFWCRARLFFAGYGISINRVMTDNGPAYRSRLFNRMLDAQGIKHVFTRPYHPQANGKVERFNRTLAAGWAYADTYDSEAARAQRYPVWLHYYNHHRPHNALGGRTPAQVIHNLTGHNN